MPIETNYRSRKIELLQQAATLQMDALKKCSRRNDPETWRGLLHSWKRIKQYIREIDDTLWDDCEDFKDKST